MVDKDVNPVGTCSFYLQGRRKMDAEGSFTMLVHIFQTTQQYFAEPSNFHSQRCENIRSQ
jgi:hypothetical protein